MFSLVLLSACQKAQLIDGWTEKSGGRNGTEQSDTIAVTPDLDIAGWEGAIDAGFTFGGEKKQLNT